MDAGSESQSQSVPDAGNESLTRSAPDAGNKPPSADGSLRRHLVAVHDERIAKIKAFARRTDHTYGELEEFMASLDMTVLDMDPRKFEEDFNRALPMMAEVSQPLSGTRFIELRREGNRAGYIFERGDDPRGFEIGIAKFIRQDAKSWRVISSYTLFFGNETHKPREQQIAEHIATTPEFNTLYAKTELDFLFNDPKNLRGKFRLDIAFRDNVTVRINRVDLTVNKFGVGRLLGKRVAGATPLSKIDFFRDRFALNWGRNQITVKGGAANTWTKTEFSLAPRHYDLPALYLVLKGEAPGSVNAEFEISRTQKDPFFPKVVANAPAGTYGAIFVKARMADVTWELNGERVGTDLQRRERHSLHRRFQTGQERVLDPLSAR